MNILNTRSSKKKATLLRKLLWIEVYLQHLQTSITSNKGTKINILFVFILKPLAYDVNSNIPLFSAIKRGLTL